MRPLAALCRIYGLDLPTSSTITGMRGAAGGCQPAAANPSCMLLVCIDAVSTNTTAAAVDNVAFGLPSRRYISRDLLQQQ